MLPPETPNSSSDEGFNNVVSELPSYRRLELCVPTEDSSAVGPALVVVHVVGGAHLSEASTRNAAAMVHAVQPREVLLELCGERTELLTDRTDGSPRPPLPPLGKFLTDSPWVGLNPVFW